MTRTLLIPVLLAAALTACSEETEAPPQSRSPAPPASAGASSEPRASDPEPEASDSTRGEKIEEAHRTAPENKPESGKQ